MGHSSQLFYIDVFRSLGLCGLKWLLLIRTATVHGHSRCFSALFQQSVILFFFQLCGSSRLCAEVDVIHQGLVLTTVFVGTTHLQLGCTAFYFVAFILSSGADSEVWR